MRGRRIDIDSLEGLHEVAQRFIKAHENNDIETQRDILRQLVESEQQLYQRKLRLLAELKTLMQEARAATEPELRIARLVQAFRFSCDLRAIGYRELVDKETGDKAQAATFKTYDQLKNAGPEGEAAIVSFLDDPSENVRSSAAALLLEQMPERAIPVIEELERTAPGSDAAMSAGLVLLRYRQLLARQSKSTPPQDAS